MRLRQALVVLTILIGISGGIWVALIPYRRRTMLHRNEREANNVMFNLRDAERTFRESDSDHNGISDYWTGDVSGLYKYGLVERSVAEADASPLDPLVPTPIPHHGYFFRALDGDDQAPTTEFSYKVDTGGRLKMGNVHHRFKFGFCGYPAEAGRTGRLVFIINESGSVLFSKTEVPPTSWPDDEAIKNKWSRE